MNKPSKFPRKTVAAGLVVALGLGGYLMTRDNGAEDKGGKTQTFKVARQDLGVSVNANGTLDNPSTVTMNFPQGGTLLEVNVKVGDRVRVGQPLARVDNQQLAAAAQTAKAALDAAQIKQGITAAGGTPEQKAVERENKRMANLTARQAREAYRQQKEQLQFSQNNTAATVQAARTKLASLLNDKAAADRQVASKQGQGEELELEAAKSRQSALESAVADARETLATAEREAASTAFTNRQSDKEALRNLQQARATRRQSMVQSRQSTHPGADTLADVASSVVSARGQYLEAQRNLAQARMVSTADGVVTAINGKVGDVLTGGGGGISGASASAGASGEGSAPSTSTSSGGGNQSFITISTGKKMDVKATFVESDAVKLKVGQIGSATFNALPDKPMRARLAAIDPNPTNNGGVVAYGARFELTGEPPAGLRPGMSVALTLTLQQRPGVLVVPAGALVDGPEGSAVKVRKDGKVTTVPVKTGMRADGMVEIVAGLKEGDVVEYKLDAMPAGGGMGDMGGDMGGGMGDMGGDMGGMSGGDY